MNQYNKFFFVSTLWFCFSMPGFPANPGQVARLSYSEGEISFIPAIQKKWVKATLNRPYVLGDRLWASTRARAELQLTSGVLRLGNLTSIKILNLSEQIFQFQLSQGTIAVNIRQFNPKQTLEIDTPNLAFVTKLPGNYRLQTDIKSKTTIISIQSGEATVYGEKSSYRIRKGLSCVFTGSDLKNHQCGPLKKPDDFDRWTAARDKQFQRPSNYVSQQVIGHQDLDNHGSWKVVKRYGRVWVPNVTSSWVPYRTGQWIWLDAWGWTWVDEQPWGFAPFHYGRWAFIERRWSWIPGPIEVAPVYAPALVVFIGGRNQRLLLSNRVPGIAWFPLGPGEVYIPPYRVSRDYFINVNRSNTFIGNAAVVNVFNNQNVNINYQNIQITNAVTAVPTNVFVSSAPVAPQVVQAPVQAIESAPKTQIAEVAPEPASITGTQEAATPPPADVISTPAVAKTDPPPPPPTFDETQKALEKDPGVPLSDSESEKLNSDKKESNITIVESQPDVSIPEVQPNTETPATTTETSPVKSEETGTPAVVNPQPIAPEKPQTEPVLPEVPTQPPETQPAEEIAPPGEITNVPPSENESAAPDSSTPAESDSTEPSTVPVEPAAPAQPAPVPDSSPSPDEPSVPTENSAPENTGTIPPDEPSPSAPAADQGVSTEGQNSAPSPAPEEVPQQQPDTSQVDPGNTEQSNTADPGEGYSVPVVSEPAPETSSGSQPQMQQPGYEESPGTNSSVNSEGAVSGTPAPVPETSGPTLENNTSSDTPSAAQPVQPSIPESNSDQEPSQVDETDQGARM